MTKEKTQSDPLASYKIGDPEEFARNVLKAYEDGGRAVTQFLDRSDTQMTPFSAASEMTRATETMSAVYSRWMSEPAKLVQAQAELVGSYAELWNRTMQRMLGIEPEPVIEPAPTDNR